jgi:hypothetical protein
VSSLAHRATKVTGQPGPRTQHAAAPGRRSPLLGRLHAVATAQRRTTGVVEIRTRRALALAASGEEHAALNALAKALTESGQSGLVQKALQPPSGQARRVQPHRSHHPGTSTRPDPYSPATDSGRHRRALGPPGGTVVPGPACKDSTGMCTVG